MSCCAAPKFELVEELGHVEAVDWDLGTCASCGAPLLRQWSPHRPANVYVDALTPEEGARFRDTQGRERASLLKQWYNDH